MQNISCFSKVGLFLILGITLAGCGQGDANGVGGKTGGARAKGGASGSGGGNGTGAQGGNSSGGSSSGGTSAISSGGTTASGGIAASGGSATGGSSAPLGGTTVVGGAAQGGSTTSGGKAGSTSTGGTTQVTTTGGTSSAQGGTSGTGGPTGRTAKPRIIATNDGEKDDQDSMVRFLMYSSDFDVVGIVENNSRYQNSGHSKSKWIQARIDLYAQILPNLHKHNPNFPAPDALKAAIKLGNENSADLFKAPQDMATKDTPGSLHIIATLLDKDPRVVHVPSWGGANTTAYALWKLKTEYTKEQFEYAANRIWIYGICYDLAGHAQDGGFKWIIDNIPEAKLYQATWWSRTWNYSSVGSGSSNPSEIQAYMSEAWLSENAKSGHGPLGAAIGQAYVSEGDTPSWLSLINNGLQQHVDYTLGGWGGRAVYQDGTGAKGWMIDGIEDPDDKNPATRSSRAWWRWIPAAQNDYAARMDWAVADDFKKANHNPVAKVKGDLVRSVAAGATIDLDASETTDPDGNALTFKWWQYHEADSVSAKVTISSDTAKTGARFTVPSEPGKQVQIILEVTDDGKPPLTHYQRLLFNIQ